MMGRISAACAAALLLAFGVGAATPASAQGYYQDSYYQPAPQDMLEAAPPKTPWYMPQAWMYPRNTAPVIERRPGEYGSARSYSRNAYGGFGNYCYGNCGIRRGTIATGSGVVLWEPDIVMFDQRIYQVVPRVAVAMPEPPVAMEQRAPRPTADSLIRVSTRQQSVQRNLVGGTPRFSVQNGVRIIAPQPLDQRQ